jgi:hypothetical protein
VTGTDNATRAAGGIPALPPRSTLPRTSEVLRDLALGAGERVSFREIVRGLRHRAFGFTTLVFALPCCLPMLPGIPTVCGFALVIIALNLVAARRRLWLPSLIAEKTIARVDLERLVARAVPHLQRLERFSRPRLEIVTETAGKRLIGLVLFVLGVVMILPIPFVGNMPPGVAATIIAVGLIERDGVVVLAGLAASIVAVAVASAATGAAILWLVNLFTG